MADLPPSALLCKMPDKPGLSLWYIFGLLNGGGADMDFGLQGKKAFVGGGGRGIGKAIARELAREGVDVVIASRTLSELEKSAREIEDETPSRLLQLMSRLKSR